MEKLITPRFTQTEAREIVWACRYKRDKLNDISPHSVNVEILRERKAIVSTLETVIATLEGLLHASVNS